MHTHTHRTPLTAAFLRPGWFHVALLALAAYFAYLAGQNFSSYGRGKPFRAVAACLRVLDRRGGPAAAGPGSGPAVAALGLLRGGCPVAALTTSESSGDGDLCITFAGEAVDADGYYFTTLGPGSPPALDPVCKHANIHANIHTYIHTFF